MERWWGAVFLLLAACEPEPKGPVQVVQPEAMRFDTEHIRREVDNYRTQPSAVSKRKMEQAFEAFDKKVKGLEEQAPALSGTERLLAEQRIADMKHRRELHWVRAQEPIAQTQTVKRAESVGQRVTKAERANGSQQTRRAERSRAAAYQQPNRSAPPPNFFQRLFFR